jgi:hypothetical protein
MSAFCKQWAWGHWGCGRMSHPTFTEESARCLDLAYAHCWIAGLVQATGQRPSFHVLEAARLLRRVWA